MKNSQTVFQSSRSVRVLISLYQHSLLYLFDFSNPCGCGEVSCAFCVHFPNEYGRWASYVLIDHFFEQLSVKILVLFFNWIIFLLLSCKSFYMFWTMDLYQVHDLQIFFPFYRLSFHFLGNIIYTINNGINNAWFWCPIYLFL